MGENKSIYANISAVNLQELKEKFKAVDIDSIIEKKVKYYQTKPFPERTKLIWIDKIKEWIELINEDAPEEEQPKQKITSLLQSYYNKTNLAEDIYNLQPYFYDSAKIWWLWNLNLFKWEIKDDKDILNIVNENSDANTVNSKEKNEILESMQQFGRKKIPKPIKKTWIQFKDLIVDIETGEEFKASPEYFVTNPIPWELHKERYIETPVMDKIFEEWVSKDYIQTLYEILAYCLLPDYPIHRLFCFVGKGMNGKSKFMELLMRFVGIENITATELDILLSSRFEVTRLHKKLVCIMGETNFHELSKTSLIKKLTGQDVIGFEYKNKNPFEDQNYAKILIATNTLPVTTDKTIGFYRRWLIIDFPNTFSEQKDILKEIPKEEYEILAVKSLKILKDLLDNRQFHNEGDIELRMKRYEDKSNPLDKFIKEECEVDPNSYSFKGLFREIYKSFLQKNGYRVWTDREISLSMKEKEFESRQVYIDGYNKETKRFEKTPYWAYSGIRLKQDKLDKQHTST